ncbi:unnamed protein product [Clavelina lepadiformis]|uniref:DH domain-containing protein n=1 Tax=Clavelina lepadiformis TaxID=159417 RepID=A0ABP0FHE0_CLALP
MATTQAQKSVAVLAGVSLFLHLCSAGNFIPSSEMWFFGSLLSYLHSMLNLLARSSLLSAVVLIAVESYYPNTISSYTQWNGQYLIKFLPKFVMAALVCTVVRIILPGPITYYSRFYKFSIVLSFIATVLAAIDHNSSSSGKNKNNVREEGVQDLRVSRQESTNSNQSENYIPSKRHRTAMELLQTETSYLRNLKTIITVYKEPLEKFVVEGHPLLAAEDIRSVFGGISQIAELHSFIHKDLSEIIDNWSENCCVADLFIKYEEKMIKVYPPYVNYFDMGSEILQKQQKSNPELQEFFTKCFHEPQSLKQPLSALLIRPVQRLPSISLLIGDLRKRTPKDLEDYEKLEEAKEVLSRVLSHINEDKRKTEGKMKIFDIVYEVTGCPVEVVSSNRLFIAHVDVATLTDGFYRSGERLALYLLNDVMEVAKWRNRTHGNSLLKHIQLLKLSSIVSILDMNDCGELQNIFAVRYQPDGNNYLQSNANELEEKTCLLHLLDDKTFKSKWLQQLSTQVAEAKNITTDKILKKVTPSDLINFVKRGSKLHKKFSRAKLKSE